MRAGLVSRNMRARLHRAHRICDARPALIFKGALSHLLMMAPASLLIAECLQQLNGALHLSPDRTTPGGTHLTLHLDFVLTPSALEWKQRAPLCCQYNESFCCAVLPFHFCCDSLKISTTILKSFCHVMPHRQTAMQQELEKLRVKLRTADFVRSDSGTALSEQR